MMKWNQILNGLNSQSARETQQKLWFIGKAQAEHNLNEEKIYNTNHLRRTLAEY